MPASSKKQQRFFGMVHAVQKGELSPGEVGPAVRKAAKNTEYSDAKDIASTKHKNLPEKKAAFKKVKEILKKIKDKSSFKNIDDEDVDDLLLFGGVATVGGGGAGVAGSKLTEKKGSLQMKYFEKNANKEKDKAIKWFNEASASAQKTINKNVLGIGGTTIAAGAAIGALISKKNMGSLVPGAAIGAGFGSIGLPVGGIVGVHKSMKTPEAKKIHKKYYGTDDPKKFEKKIMKNFKNPQELVDAAKGWKK